MINFDEIAVLFGFKYFWIRREAEEYVDNYNRNCATGSKKMLIFANEINTSKSRTFIPATPARFFDAYKFIPRYHRSFYEVLRADKPCNLYLDIEFYTQLNPGLIGETVMKVIRLILHREVYLFVLQCLTTLTLNVGKFMDFTEFGNFVELDASAPWKYSKHVIGHLPFGVVFMTTSDCEVFVDRLISSFTRCLKDASSWGEEFGFTIPSEIVTCVHHINAYKRTDVIDRGVYTKNHDFRLIYSSKFEDLHNKQGNRHLYPWNIQENRRSANL